MIRAIVLLIGLTLVGLFALLNWPAFVAPASLSLGFTTSAAVVKVNAALAGAPG